MRVCWLAAPLVFAGVLGWARAQDTAPSEMQRWDEVVQTFAATLRGELDRKSLEPLLTPHSWVAPFARNRSESVAVLPERLAGLAFVGAHSYLHPSISAATDLIADVEANATIDADIRARIIPKDRTNTQPADAIMARWFATALEAQPNDPIALISFYDAGQKTADGVTKPTLVLVIVRGSFTAQGTCVIDRALYGSLEAAVR